MALRTTPMMGLPQSPSFRYKQLNPAYQSDPRRILGQSLMTQGSSSAPVRTPLQGLGRLSSALVGAYLQKGAMDRQVEREGAYDDKLTNAMKNIDIGSLPPGMKAAFDINREFGFKQYLNFEQQKQLAALLGGPQVQQASFFAPGSIDTQGAFAAQQAGQQNAYNQAMQSRSADLGGMFGLAGNLGSAYLLS